MHRDVRSHRRPTALLAASIAALLVAGVLALTMGGASASVSTQLQTARDTLANCQLLAANSAGAQRTRAQLCVTDQNRIIALLTTSPSPSGSPTVPPTSTATPTPPPTTPPATTVPPTTVPPTTVPATTPPVTTPPPTDPPPGDTLFCAPWAGVAGPFPDEHCTGWKHTGVTLHTCGDPRGSATHLEVANAIYDACNFADSVVIQAPNITIKRSWIHGTVSAHFSTDYNYLGAQIIDTEIGPSGDPDKSAVGAGPNITLLRINAHDTASGIALGNNSSITDSWVHDRLDTGAHGSAVGVGQGSGSHTVFFHNRLDCAPPSGLEHCSAAAALYDENNVTLDDILFKFNLLDSVSGYCFRNGPDTRNIRVISNTFGRKYHAQCGLFGPVAAFYVGNPGNEWTGNAYPDGTAVNASSST